MPAIQYSIVVVGTDPEERGAMVAVLRGAGCINVLQRAEYDTSFLGHDLVVVTGSGREEHLLHLRRDPNHKRLHTMVAITFGEDPNEFLNLGADDILLGDSDQAELRARLVVAGATARQKQLLYEGARFQRGLLTAQRTIAERGEGVEVMREILCMAAGLLNFDRASIIAYREPSEFAYVLAATDDPELTRFQLSIDDYPEVQESVQTERPLLIDSVTTHPVTHSMAPLLVSHGVLALAVFPVTWKGHTIGVLLFRKSQVGLQLSEEGQAFATLFASQIRDSSLFEQLRDQTRRLSRAGYEAQRRTKVIKSLSAYFEASSEGVIVVDQAGEIVYVNGSASSLTGFAKDALFGSAVTDLLLPDQSGLMMELADAVFDGRSTPPVDIQLKTTSSKYLTVSLSTSTVLSSHGAMILSFRDVSEQRSLEAQLKHSNLFLSNLIDSAVDAIIALDIGGEVILFNKGAEQLFGYQADEVLHRFTIANLYPEGVPEEVMRMLRSESYGGIGRLEQIRRTVIVRSGDVVPVNMTASMIYEDGKEVATVGIFTDLRDRIRIEQRLLRAQEQLKEQEQRSLVAGLAGAAAHELNQPLTSIIGYAQLVQRKSEVEGPHLRYAEIIVEEAERMAEIVKKIGRITHYETIPYIGTTNIVDLDRSLEISESAPVPVLILNDEERTGSISQEDIAESYEEEMRIVGAAGTKSRSGRES